MGNYTYMLAEVLDLVDGKIGLDEYPIHDEDHRKVLNEKILNHYLLWEIGTETIEQFIFALKRKMNEIMPFYVQLYNSTLLEFDPLITTVYKETIESTAKASGKEDRTSATHSMVDADSRSRAVTSETPQVMLQGSRDYATNATDSTGESKTATSGDGTEGSVASSENEGTTTRSMSGRSGLSAPELILAFRSQMLNIDMMIVEDLQPLFMGILDTYDSYTNRPSLNMGWYF